MGDRMRFTEAGALPSLSDHVPTWYRVEKWLTERIGEGYWRVGDRIPTEEELCKLHGVSRTTVRHALTNLMREGLVARRSGVGTFVLQPKVMQHLLDINSLYRQTFASLEHNADHVVREIIHAPASEEVAKRLLLPVGDKVLYIERVRLFGGKPLLLEQAFVSERLVDTEPTRAQLEHGFLINVLRECSKVELAKTSVTLEPIILTPEQTTILDTPKRALGFLITRVSFSQDGWAVLFTRNFLGGQAGRLEFEQVVQPHA